jgi:hypothetical protein
VKQPSWLFAAPRQQAFDARLHGMVMEAGQLIVGAIQDPLPSQYNVVSVFSPGPLGPVWVPQKVFRGWGAQVPVAQFALQGPAHAVPQHTLPTQNPFSHSLPVEHVAPVRLLNVAVTVAAAVTVRLHGELLVGVQPDHEKKVPVLEAVAASVTTVP